MEFLLTYALYPTVQSNYNFTHALYLMHGACVFQSGQKIIMRVPTNSHACKTRVIPTRAVLTCVPYIF